MRSILANALAYLAGLVASFCSVALVEMLGHQMFPVAGMSGKNKEELRRIVRSLPLGAFLMVELAYVTGSLSGGYVIARLAATHQMQLACGLGALLTLFGFQNLIAIPHPLWFAIVSTCTYIPMAYLGASAALRPL